MTDCAEPDCDRQGAVRLHVPWDENSVVCTAHARVAARQDGVVAEPLEGREEEWPEGSEERNDAQSQ
jgi:hypothetical protein